MTAIETIHAGVDWLSLTMKPDDPYAPHWRDKGYAALEEISKEGYEIKTRAMLGYYGYCAGNNFVGARDDGSFCQFTGPNGDKYYRDMYYPRASVPRIDLQVTVKYDEMPLDRGKNALAGALSANEYIPSARRRKVTHITNSDGGETVYIGAPTSDQRGRIYNKEKQSEDPIYARSWRYEVTFRGDKAERICTHLYLDDEGRRSAVAAIVGDWFNIRGVRGDWIYDSNLSPLPLVTSIPPDFKRTLDWLEKGVRPALYKLARAGYTDVALEALGVPYLADLP